MSSGQNDMGFVKYSYEPSLAAGVVFVVFFASTTVLHIFQMMRARTWFMIPFVIGGIFETVGYSQRIVAAEEAPGPYALTPYILQSITLLVAPALFAASIYMELGRIAAMLNADAALVIRREWLTKIFVAGDVASFLMQSAGAGFMAGGNAGKAKTGQNIIVGGLFVQVVFFGLFILAAALFQYRIGRNPTRECQRTPWKQHMLTLYLVCGLIFARSTVRVVEFIQGFKGFIITHEVFLIVFDGALMFLAMAALNWVHPGEVARLLRVGVCKSDRKEEGVTVAIQEDVV